MVVASAMDSKEESKAKPSVDETGVGDKAEADKTPGARKVRHITKVPCHDFQGDVTKLNEILHRETEGEREGERERERGRGRWREEDMLHLHT